MELSEEKIFYVYVYMDPTVEGIWEYKDFKLKNKPFYIGKGKGRRRFKHLNYAKTVLSHNESVLCRKTRKILKLLKLNFEPIIEILVKDLTEKEAYDMEMELISFFKRKDEDGGILLNYESGGYTGYTACQETKDKQSKSAKIDRAKPERREQILSVLVEAREFIDYDKRRSETDWYENICLANSSRVDFEPWNKGQSGYTINLTDEGRKVHADICRITGSKPKSKETKDKIRTTIIRIAKRGKNNTASKIVSEFDSEMNWIKDYETINSVALENVKSVTQINYAIEKNKLINNKYYFK